MVITYLGDSYFRFQSGDAVVLVDPSNQRSFKGSSLVLSSLKPALVEAEDGPFFIDHQGEYEVAGIHIRAVSTGVAKEDGDAREHTAYKILFDEITIGLLGRLSHELDSSAFEHLSGCDILVLPGGGAPYISEADAAKLVRQLEPCIVIPSLFTNPKNFAKELDAETTLEEKLVVKKKDLAAKEMRVVFLKP